MRRRKTRPSRHPRAQRRDRVWAWTCTAVVHVAVLGALFWPRAGSPPVKPDAAPELTIISLAELPKPPGPPEPEKTEAAEQAPPPVARPTPMPILVKVTSPEPPDNSDILSETQLAGAASVGEGAAGGGGGGCDTARLVQQALRKDPLVRTAVMQANRQGKAIMMWNGDWVRSGAQDGKGLSAVRQAIMWEVAFSPEACRNAPMHGPLLLSLADGGTRFAIGAGAWRWSDLLGVQQKS
jgi:hypothetical protein